MKKNVTAKYFFAYWDNNYELKNQFIDVCKAMKIHSECIDCETKDGVTLSCKYNVKLCPTILIFKNNKEVYRGRGKDAILELQNC